MRVAITRKVSPSINQCELTHLDRAPIDLALANAQHGAYERCLSSLGCNVVSLPAEAAQPDSVFVEDVAIVLDEVAVITRPGAESRRSETTSIANALEPYRALLFMEAPATLDGGDVLRIGRKLYVGVSGRTDTNAVEQLGHILEPYGYAVEGVPVRGCLHLKSAVTQVSPDTVLINPSWILRDAIAGMKTIEIAPGEDYAANSLLVSSTIVYPTCFPRTRERLEKHELQIDTLDVSELQKAEGAVTCCSLIFED